MFTSDGDVLTITFSIESCTLSLDMKCVIMFTRLNDKVEIISSECVQTSLAENSACPWWASIPFIHSFIHLFIHSSS